MHWYDLSGNPQYTILGKNGKHRATTLRDAREHKFIPSVTTILNILDKPALTNWKIDQASLYVDKAPRLEDESDADYCARIRKGSMETATDAADEGMSVHHSIECFFNADFENVLPYHTEMVLSVNKLLNDAYGTSAWISEKAFAHPMGFGGRVDLFTNENVNFPEGVVIDIKTKDFGPDDEVKGWNNHLWQLAAYRHGLELPSAQCANLFVSRNNPGVVRLVSWEQSELDHAWEAFKLMTKLWQNINKYNPMEGL